MNHYDDTERRVHAWLDMEAQGELPDWVLENALRTTRSTPQRRGLRGWLASIARHRGSATRRRNDLYTFATFTAVVAAAVIATSVMFQTAEPVTPAAEAGEIVVEEEKFTGSFTYGPACQDDDGNDVDHCWIQYGVRFDDPRFQGDVVMRANPDYRYQGIYRNQFTITTDEGAWIGDSVPGIMVGPDDGAPSVHLFTGEGAYEGLSAVAAVALVDDVFRLEGYVVSGGFPELP